MHLTPSTRLFLLLFFTFPLYGCSVQAKWLKRESVSVLPAPLGSPHALGTILPEKVMIVSSPRDGVITSLSVPAGEEVGRGQSLATVNLGSPFGVQNTSITAKQRAIALAREKQSLFEQETKDFEQYATAEAQRERERELQRLQTEKAELMGKNAKMSDVAESATFSLLDSTTAMLYTRMDALKKYPENTSQDYFRRKEVFYTDQQASKEFEQKLHSLYKELENDKKQLSADTLLDSAVDLGKDARLLVHSLRPSPKLSDTSIEEIREDIDEATDSLARIAMEKAGTEGRIVELTKQQEALRKEAPIPPPFGEAALNAKLEVAALEAELSSLGVRGNGGQMSVTISAPISGFILERLVREGESVFAGMPLMTIAQAGNHVLKFSLPEDDLPSLHIGMDIEFEPTISFHALSDDVAKSTERYHAKLSRIIPIVDPQRRTIDVEAVLAEPIPANVPVNTQAYVFLPMLKAPRFSLVPEQALTWGREGETVWTRDPEGILQERPVSLAFRYGGKAFIAKGLRPGEEALVPDFTSAELAKHPLYSMRNSALNYGKSFLTGILPKRSPSLTVAEAGENGERLSTLQRRLDRRQKREARNDSTTD